MKKLLLISALLVSGAQLRADDTLILDLFAMIGAKDADVEPDDIKFLLHNRLHRSPDAEYDPTVDRAGYVNIMQRVAGILESEEYYPAYLELWTTLHGLGTKMSNPFASQSQYYYTSTGIAEVTLALGNIIRVLKNKMAQHSKDDIQVLRASTTPPLSIPHSPIPRSRSRASQSSNLPPSKADAEVADYLKHIIQ